MSGLSAFAGTWTFDKQSSRITSPPIEWVQHIEADEEQIRIQEHIIRLTGTASVVIHAKPDGMFYPVTGSPIADEISYSVQEATIVGVGRKQGVTSFQEVISLPEPAIMEAEISLGMSEKEVRSGIARFRRAEQSLA